MRRRRFVTMATMTAAGALLSVPARAFRIEEADASVAAAYFSRCRREADHDVLAAELEAALAGKPLPEITKQQLREDARCPFCGCAYASR